MTKKLTQKQILEVIDRYDGTFQCVIQLSYDFRVPQNVIGYLVNHKGAKTKANAYSRAWRLKWPEMTKIFQKKYYKDNIEHLRKESRERYWKGNIELTRAKGRAKSKAWYQKNKLKCKK